MHGEAPPPFDGEEAGLVTKTTGKMIYIHVDTYPRTVRGNLGHVSGETTCM